MRGTFKVLLYYALAYANVLSIRFSNNSTFRNLDTSKKKAFKGVKSALDDIIFSFLLFVYQSLSNITSDAHSLPRLSFLQFSATGTWSSQLLTQGLLALPQATYLLPSFKSHKGNQVLRRPCKPPIQVVLDFHSKYNQIYDISSWTSFQRWSIEKIRKCKGASHHFFMSQLFLKVAGKSSFQVTVHLRCSSQWFFFSFEIPNLTGSN